MSELISEKELSARLGHKILIAGLAEAGKTATKRIFFLKQNSDDVSKLSATVNYERISVVVNDVPITVIDLGGQKVFLKRFLSIFSPFIFSNVKGLIYIIDVSNKSTRNNSVEYFSSCVQKLQTYSPNAKYFVLLHKNDLVRHWPNYDSIHAQLKEEFQLNSPQKITFFRSTIYSSQTVIDSFGRVIEILFPELAKNEFVKGREIGPIEEFAEKFITHGRSQQKEYLMQETQSSSSKISIDSSDENNKIPHETSRTEIYIQNENENEIQNSSYNGDTISQTDQTMNINKLQLLMEDGLKTSNSPSIDNKIEKQDSNNAQTRSDSVIQTQESSLDNLQVLMKSGIKSQELSSMDTKSQVPSIQQNRSSIQEPTSIKQDDSESKVKYLMDFYGIQRDEATEIINNEYEEIFSLAVISGVPLKLCLKVFLNYIPLIRSQPQIDVNALEKTNLLNVFIAYTKNAVKEEEMFDYLFISSQNPKLSLIEIKQKILSQKGNNYERITSRLATTTENKYTTNKIEEKTKISAKQERLNKLIFQFKGLSLEQANSLLEIGLDDTFEQAITNLNIPMNQALDIFLVKLPLLKSKGINVDKIDKRNFLLLLDNYSKKRLMQQDFYDCLIISILNPTISIELIITTYLAEVKKTIELKEKAEKEQNLQPVEQIQQQSHIPEIVTTTDNVQVRVNQLLQITTGLQMDDAIKLVELGYDELFSTAISLGYPLEIVIHTLVKIIPKVKSEGFNIQKLDKKRLLNIIAGVVKGTLKEEDILNSITISIIRPSLSLDEIIKNYLGKTQVRVLKQQELERIEKEIVPIKQLAGYGFKVELKDDNYSIEFFYQGQQKDKTVIPPTATLEDVIYLLSYELDLPFVPKSVVVNFTARQILEEIRKVSAKKTQ